MSDDAAPERATPRRIGLGGQKIAEHYLGAFRWTTVRQRRHRIGRWLRLEGPVCDVPR
jgi:hypothetical protein